VARGATWKLRANGGFDNLNSMSISSAIDTVANYFGVTSLSAPSLAALTAAQQSERGAQRWKSWWAPTNLLTMMMLTPEFNMA
jgi:hypothetical protein